MIFDFKSSLHQSRNVNEVENPPQRAEAHSARNVKMKRQKQRIWYQPAISLNSHSIRYRTTQIYFEFVVVVTEAEKRKLSEKLSFDFPEFSFKRGILRAHRKGNEKQSNYIN